MPSTAASPMLQDPAPPAAAPQAATPARRGRAARLLAGAALGAVLLYAATLLAVWLGQERLLFHPQPLPAAQALATQPDLHESHVDVPGARLSVLELRLPNPKGVVFFLHGNGGNLASWFVNTGLYHEANFDLVMLDYRGYGKSTGHIESEAQLHADVQAVWQQVAPRYQGKRVVIYGRSLGTGLAASLAAQVQPDLTLLVSPYSSMAALARQHYAWVPSAVLRYPLRTDEALLRIGHPVLLLHGDQDTLIPPAHSRALLALTHQARLGLVRGAGHGDMQDFPSYRNAVLNALHAL